MTTNQDFLNKKAEKEKEEIDFYDKHITDIDNWLEARLFFDKSFNYSLISTKSAELFELLKQKAGMNLNCNINLSYDTFAAYIKKYLKKHGYGICK